MSKNNDPAFPMQGAHAWEDLPGLTKLEWFAGMALTGIVVTGLNISPHYSDDACNADMVERVFNIAELMLAESEKRNERTK